jgi:hypothetical protein
MFIEPKPNNLGAHIYGSHSCEIAYIRHTFDSRLMPELVGFFAFTQNTG